MKKIFTISFVLIITLFITSGCNNKKVKDTDIDDTSMDEITNYEMFNGNIDKSWDEVKDDYEAIELEAKREISQMNDIEVNDIKSLENTIEEKYKNIKNGINEDNEEDAKDLYKSAIKIEEISKRNNKNINHELVTLSQDSKSLIKHYYGEAEDDFTNVKNSFEAGIENIKNYTEDKWQEFLDLLK